MEYIPRPIPQSIVALLKVHHFLTKQFYQLLRLIAWIQLPFKIRVMLKQRNIETVGASLRVFGESNGAFPEAMRLYKIALTIPVASASAERFFLVLI